MVNKVQYFGIRDLREKIGDFANSAQSGEISIISRSGRPLTINIPFDDVLIEMGAHKSLAIKLYEEEVLSLSKAARYAGVKTDEFIKLLGVAGISVLGDVDSLKSELNQF
ncbi:MAG: UPF0175 family protein [gamma proteobacterium symbiont of Taylorina sp.]|nr:UPF0175 family protein [gamma proteobacterium symbiont of Taylorina sp.]